MYLYLFPNRLGKKTWSKTMATTMIAVFTRQGRRKANLSKKDPLTKKKAIQKVTLGNEQTIKSYIRHFNTFGIF